MILCSKLKNGLFKIVTKSQVVTKFTVTKSRLYCSSPWLRYLQKTCGGQKSIYFYFNPRNRTFLVKIRKNHHLVKRTPKSLESTIEGTIFIPSS